MTHRLDLTDELHQRLRGVGHLPAGQVTEVIARHGLTIDELLVALLPLAAERARAPVSKFPVGAVALGMPPADDPDAPGACYLGANLEFARLPLSMTVHAEQSAVNNAWLHNEGGLQAIAVTAAPCGFCRQLLYELTTAAELRVLIASPSGRTRRIVETALTRLLPRPFGPRDLERTAGLMSTPHPVFPKQKMDRCKLADFASRTCYAPYSGVLSGSAVQRRAGPPVLGRAAENAAFNPSLLALASALSLLAMTIPADAPWDIEWAVVHEDPACSTPGRKSGLILISEAVLQSVAPDIKLQTSSVYRH